MNKSGMTYITKDKKAFDLIVENHGLLLCFQHFEIDFAVDNKSIELLCDENNVDLNTFIAIVNMYNGFYPTENDVNRITDITSILMFLKNSHRYYLGDKYPELKSHIEKINTEYHSKNIQLVDKFFAEYFEEVLEHLRYEEEIAFPYFKQIQKNSKPEQEKAFTVKEYRSHHSDIETKLADIKNLFLKHLKIECDLNLKRKFLVALLGLEFDLIIHSTIEEKILIPLVEKIEARENE